METATLTVKISNELSVAQKAKERAMLHIIERQEQKKQGNPADNQGQRH